MADVERIKADSRRLRGTLADSLVDPVTGAETVWATIGQEVGAGNGLRVRVIPAEVIRGEGSSIVDVVSPPRLQLLDATVTPALVLDEVIVIDPFSPILRIQDFNGRLLIVANRPDEPALAQATHTVIDVADGTCVEVFTHLSGAVALTGPDVVVRPPDPMLPATIGHECLTDDEL